MLIVLRLSNSETVVGLLSYENDSILSIQDPFQLEMRADTKGYRSMILYRYNQFAKDSTMEFNKNQIIGTYYADHDLTDYYYYTLDHTIKFRDQAMSVDIQRACDYLHNLIDNNNEPIKMEDKSVRIVVDNTTSSNTVH